MSQSTEEEQVRDLLGSEFEIKAFKSPNAAVQEFRASLDKRSVNTKAQKHWRQAWENFENVSEQYIEKIPAIRFNNRDPLALKKFHIAYKRRAVTNFLPYFESRVPYLSGRAKRSAEGSIKLLKYWRAELSLPDTNEIREPIAFEEAIPAEPLLLEGPELSAPSQDGKLQIRQVPRPRQAGSITSLPSATGSISSSQLPCTSVDSFDNLDSDSDFDEWERSVNL